MKHTTRDEGASGREYQGKSLIQKFALGFGWWWEFVHDGRDFCAGVTFEDGVPRLRIEFRAFQLRELAHRPFLNRLNGLFAGRGRGIGG